MMLYIDVDMIMLNIGHFILQKHSLIQVLIIFTFIFLSKELLKAIVQNIMK